MGTTETCWGRVRQSSYILLVIVSLSLFTDSLLLTLVDPILPDIIRRIDNITGDDVSQSINNNGKFGFLVAAKGAAQFICNPFVGILISRFGYRKPMLVGEVMLLISTTAFAFGDDYIMLFVTRLVQGVSSSVAAVTGMGLLASTFSDDKERGKMMGIAIGGLSMGIIFGPVYGSILYQLWGQMVPFLVLSGMVCATIVLQLVTLQTDKDNKDHEHGITSIVYLLKDPYILVVAGNIFFLNLDVSVILAFLPMYLIDLEDPPPWKLGIVVLPTSIGYLLASLVFPRCTHLIPRWLCGLLGMLISAGTLVALAFCKDFTWILLVTGFLGIALGMVSTAMQPIFAYLVDIRHKCTYGNAYAISDMSVCLAMFLGPLVGGLVHFQFGFKWLILGVAAANAAFSQLSILLRNPPARNYLTKENAGDKYVPTENTTLLPDHADDMNSNTSTVEQRNRCNSISSQSSQLSAPVIISQMTIPYQYLD